jgi:hypothetical protein
VLEFNVPLSLPDGTIQHPGPEDQYAVDVASKVFTNGGIGNDWGVFQVFNNSITGLQPIQAQGASFNVVQDYGPPQIRITGYGVDFNDPTHNQAQQTHVGPNVGSSANTMRYQTDTEGGNSGSPVIDEATGYAVGVHTHGGCETTGGGSNKGTSTFHPNFWAALNVGAPIMVVTAVSPWPDSLDVTLPPNQTQDEFINIANTGTSPLNVSISVTGRSAASAKVDIFTGDAKLKSDILAVGKEVPLEELRNRRAPFSSSVMVGSDAIDKNMPVDRSYTSGSGVAKVGSTPFIEGEEVFGSNANIFLAGPRTRGNIFECTNSTVLTEHRLYLNPSVTTQMWLLIYEGSAAVGIYNLVNAVDVSPQGPGEGWYSSGPINVPMTAGNHYLIVASFEQLTNYWNEQGIVPYPIPASFGFLTAGAGWNWAPTSNFPPDPTQNVTAGAYGDPVAYYQTIVTGAPPSWLTVIPNAGMVPPGSSVDVTVTFNSTGLAGGHYDADIIVSGNDPLNPQDVVHAHMFVFTQITPAQPGICYASTGGGGSNPSSLLTIDKNTGAGTLIGSSGLNGLPGLAINSKGSIYATERSSGDLYRIDAATGAAIFVGVTQVPFMDAIAFDGNDVLYGIDNGGSGFLWTIDTLTAATFGVGPVGELMSGMAFDPTDGTLYASGAGVGAVPDGIFTIDKNTGATFLKGLTGLGGPTPDLCFDAAGNLHGAKGGGSNPNDLISIDKSNGTGSVIGPIGFQSVSGMASLPVQMGPVIGFVACPPSGPQGSTVAVEIKVDMTGSPPPDDLLGSFTGTLAFDPALVSVNAHSGILSGFIGNVVVSPGLIDFNGVNPTGVGGVVDILNIDFDVNGPVGATVVMDLEFSAMLAAISFTNLLPGLLVIDCSFDIYPPCLLGDVNGDGQCNSSDALLILSHDVGIPVPPNVLALILQGCGDVNGDGFTNSGDALIVLSFDVGIPVPFPVCQ